MSELDHRLRAIFAEDPPAANDAAFTMAVMANVARQRFALEVAALSAVTALGGLVLWAVWPLLAPVLVSVSQGLAQGLAPLGAALAIAVGAVVLIGGQADTLLARER